MIVVVNGRKTAVATTIGLCFIGSLYAAYWIYLRSKRKAAANSKNASKAKTSGHHHNHHKSHAKLERPNSISSEHRSRRLRSSLRSSANQQTISTSSLVSANGKSDEQKNLPAEELLELGLNYLTQAIKSWETALDSIENSAYMQSQVLALPNDEHADLVYKLRNLVENANNIIVQCGVPKLVKSSQTLQIIQSRLAHKQQLYTEALIRNSSGNYGGQISSMSVPEAGEASEEAGENNVNDNRMRSPSPSGSWRTVAAASSKRGYLSDEDNDEDSFVSADSDVDWLTEEMLQNIENVDNKNVLYEMAVSTVNLGGVSYRVSRATLLNCASEKDFAAKLHVIRLGFDKLLQDASKRQWFTDIGRNLLMKLMQKADKDCTGLNRAYDELIRFVSVEQNWKPIRDELATRDVHYMNFYDVALDFILIDAFEDLENPPSAIVAVIQNRWLSQSFKETALATAVWSVLKAKRRLLKYPDGFITRFYALNEYLIPVLAWGFLGPIDSELSKSCIYLKNQVIEYLTCLFDINRTRYTNLEELTQDIDAHSTSYLQTVLDNI